MIDLTEHFNKVRLQQRDVENALRVLFDAIGSIRTTVSVIIESQETLTKDIQRAEKAKTEILGQVNDLRERSNQELDAYKMKKISEIDASAQARIVELERDTKEQQERVSQLYNDVATARQNKDREMADLSKALIAAKAKQEADLAESNKAFQAQKAALQKQIVDIQEQVSVAVETLSSKQSEIAAAAMNVANAEARLTQVRALLRTLSSEAGVS